MLHCFERRLTPACFPGTLTLNQLSVDKPTCMVLGGRELEEVLKWGALSANIVSEEPIDVVLHEAYDDHDNLWNDYTLQKFIPFNPTDKYTIAHVKNNKTGETTRIMKGAPQVRLPSCWLGFLFALAGSPFCACRELGSKGCLPVGSSACSIAFFL